MNCTHNSGWLTGQTADECLEDSLVLNWKQNSFAIFGQEIPLPRREIIFGDEAYQYSYSKGRVVLEAQPWPDWLRELRDRISAETGYQFPLVIGNRYDSGKDHIGWHDDGRPQLGTAPAIASISLGATRRFQTRAKPSYKGERTAITTYILTHGDLVVMPPGFQETHRHRLVKEANSNGIRVNWTFRPWRG